VLRRELTTEQADRLGLRLPPDALKVGAMLTATGPQGQAIPVRVHEIKESTVIMYFNHPLAGKTLLFDIKITEIKAAE